MCYSVMVAKEVRTLQKRFGEILIREDEESLFDAVRVTKHPPWPPLQQRIFSGHFAKVVSNLDVGPSHEKISSCEEVSSVARLSSRLMRYSAYCPKGTKNHNLLSTFNARRDNLLSTFWESAFRKGHGFLSLECFFEWVKVSDVVKAGDLELGEVAEHFHKQSEARKQKLLALGKPWKPTPTERLNPLDRKVVVQFRSSEETSPTLFVPVIFNRNPEVDVEQVRENFAPSRFNEGFAIVTDDPIPDVMRAGHDRTPAFLTEADIKEWLNFSSKKPKELLELLKQRPKIALRHSLETLFASPP